MVRFTRVFLRAFCVRFHTYDLHGLEPTTPYTEKLNSFLSVLTKFLPMSNGHQRRNQ